MCSLRSEPFRFFFIDDCLIFFMSGSFNVYYIRSGILSLLKTVLLLNIARVHLIWPLLDSYLVANNTSFQSFYIPAVFLYVVLIANIRTLFFITTLVNIMMPIGL